MRYTDCFDNIVTAQVNIKIEPRLGTACHMIKEREREKKNQSSQSYGWDQALVCETPDGKDFASVYGKIPNVAQ